MNKSAFAMGWLAGIGTIIVFVTLLGGPVSAQQQTSSADTHQMYNSNQSGGSSTIQQQQNTTTTPSGMVMMGNQMFNTTWISFVSSVKVTGISIIGNDHTGVNLRYDGEGPPPGASVVVVAVTNNSPGMMRGQQGETMMDMIMANKQQLNSSADSASKQHQEHQMQNSSASATNSSMPISSTQSGSNYLEAGWQGQEPNSATVLVQLEGGIPKGAHIMVMVFPFLHH
jgi:hypothetical protein